MSVMTFRAACSPAISQFVKNKNVEEHPNLMPRTYEAIRARHYIDDYLDSFDTIKEAKEVLAEVIGVHADSGFNLCAISSNNSEVLSAYITADEMEKLLGDSDETVKVLGMLWDPHKDTLRYRVNQSRIGDDKYLQLANTHQLTSSKNFNDNIRSAGTNRVSDPYGQTGAESHMEETNRMG